MRADQETPGRAFLLLTTSGLSAKVLGLKVGSVSSEKTSTQWETQTAEAGRLFPLLQVLYLLSTGGPASSGLFKERLKCILFNFSFKCNVI